MTENGNGAAAGGFFLIPQTSSRGAPCGVPVANVSRGAGCGGAPRVICYVWRTVMPAPRLKITRGAGPYVTAKPFWYVTVAFSVLVQTLGADKR